MTTATVIYQGSLRTAATHQASQNQIITDAPIDNHGKGEAFSPTDLVATALASCMMTIMGIKANEMNIDLSGMQASVEKVMSASPRRIAEVIVNIHIPQRLDDKTKKILQAAAHTCPVAQSLHSDVIQNISFLYSE